MKGRFWRKTLAAAMALLIVSGSVPIKPISDIFGDMAITANAETATSTITVDGTDYTLYTGFTATAGTAGAFGYANFVDGNTSTKWRVEKKDEEFANDFAGGTEDPAYVEFHADAPFIPKGYILTYDNSVNERWKPTSWALKAKLNESDNWTTIHSSNSSLGYGSRFEIACNNDGDNMYQYFRFEIYDVGTTDLSILNELEFYGSLLTYTHLTVKAATCTETGIKQECYRRNSDGKYFTDETGTTELAESDVIDQIKPHTCVHHEATDVNIEYWQCSVCSKYFSDEDCTTEITEEQTKIYRTVTIDDAINGLVTSSVDKALAGTTVMFSVADYRIDVSTLKVNDGAVELTAVNDIWYAFTMPAADVTVTAEVVQSNVDGDMLTGSIRHTVTIVDGASITLNNATITGGIVCEGSATITLVGTNSVSGPTFKAGIQIGGSGTTLTIKGNGSLTANGYDQSAGIGLSRAWNPASDVIGGDIVIEGGNITANGGSQWGAGIGTGVIFGNGSAKTARIGNITIKGGTVKATGGTSADGIGTGYAYSGCTNAIGTVTIYDGINLVDASSIKDFGSVVYMHGENDITANASDYFAINGSTITLKDYNLTTTGEHGTITAKVGDTSAATAHYGDTVTLNVTPDEGYVLKSLTVKDADENEIEVENNQFNMPLKDVTITAEFVPIEYTISYELGDAQNSPSNPASYTVESEDIILAAPTGDDSFEGWYDNATFKGEPVTKIEKGSRGDITLYAKFGDMSIEQASLTLNGDIGVTVDMSIPEKYTGGEYYMTISTPRQATKECSLSDALIAENGLYRFTFYVAAKEMTDSIDFTLTNGTDNVKTESVSVRDVALSYLAEETKYEKEIPLVKAMLNYGAYAQEFLNYTNDDHLANKGFEDSRIDALTADELQKYAYKTEYSNLPEGVTCTGVSLSLKSEMALNLTFNNTTGKKLTFAVPSGYEVTTSGTGKKIKVKVTGIKAEYIGNDVEVSVTFDGQSGYYQKYNPMTFGYNRIKANDPEAGLSKAMYYYYLAADEYINS